MCRKIRCDRKSEKNYRIYEELNKTEAFTLRHRQFSNSSNFDTFFLVFPLLLFNLLGFKLICLVDFETQGIINYKYGR